MLRSRSISRRTFNLGDRNIQSRLCCCSKRCCELGLINFSWANFTQPTW